LPDARSPRFGLSSPGTNNIIYPASALSLKKRAAMIHVILSLMTHTCCASPARHSTLHTLSVPALLVPARGVRRPFRLCAMLSNHTQDQILIIALCASRRMAPYTTVVRSLEYNRCPSPPQRCPYPRTTTALPRPIHPSTRHNTLLLALRPSHRSSHLLFARHSATRHFTLRTALRLFARPLFALLHHLFSTSMAPLS
jgi:hypothetical protein